MRKSKANILVIEDDLDLQSGLVEVLLFHGYTAEGAGDGGEGLAKVLQGGFDLVLLDVMLPTMDGFEVCRRIRMERPNQAVLMLTAKGAENDIVEGFKAGADDYVTKPFSLKELLARVEALLRRSGKILGEGRFTHLDVEFDAEKLIATRGGKQMEMTRKEIDILIYLQRNQGRTITRKELLEEVWGYASGDVETRTVDIHMQKLRKKLSSLYPESPEPPTFIDTVRGEGFRFGGEADR